jgi:hypothetical protein
MRSLVLIELVLSQSLERRGPCPECAQITFQTLRFPFIHQRMNMIELIYPTQCRCGAHGCLPIRMPILQFGLFLAKGLLLSTQRRRSKATLTLRPQESSFAAQVVAEFEFLMDSYLAARPPTPQDQRAFGMNDQEWTDFMRRLDNDRPPPEPNSGGADK